MLVRLWAPSWDLTLTLSPSLQVLGFWEHLEQVSPKDIENRLASDGNKLAVGNKLATAETRPAPTNFTHSFLLPVQSCPLSPSPGQERSEHAPYPLQA